MSQYGARTHRIYMTFFVRDGYQVQFLEADLKTPLPTRLVFHDDGQKIREIAKRGEALGTVENREMLDAALQVGRGGLYLNLTEEQYQRLVKKPAAPAPNPAASAHRPYKGQPTRQGAYAARKAAVPVPFTQHKRRAY